MNLDLDAEINSSGFFNGMRPVWIAIGATTLLFALSGLTGCSQLMGGLRPDLNDEFKYESEPTKGGRMSEASLLDDGRARGPDSEESIAHREHRGTSVGRLGGQGSWVQPGDEERESMRRPQHDSEDEEQPKLAARPTLQKKYKSGNRATRADFVDDARDDGSLWTSEGQTNYFLTKNQIKSEGDLVTVITDEEFIKDIAGEIKRTLSPNEREAEIEIAQERLRRKTMGLPEEGSAGAVSGDQVASTQAAANRAPASDSKGEKKDVDVPTVAWADVDLRKSIEFKATDPVMMEVAERYPNGNYKLRGLKRVRFHGQTKMMSVTAIAKNSDISTDETINAGKLYEYRIEAVR